MYLFSGEIGIRTPGTSRYNSFQDCRNRPLCHFSRECVKVIYFFVLQQLFSIIFLVILEKLSRSFQCDITTMRILFLFFALFSSVTFGTKGLFSPKPYVRNKFGLHPLLNKNSFTELALFSERL